MKELGPDAKRVLQNYCEETRPAASEGRDQNQAIAEIVRLAKVRALRRRVAIVGTVLAVAASLLAVLVLRPGRGAQFVEQSRPLEATDLRAGVLPGQARPGTAPTTAALPEVTKQQRAPESPSRPEQTATPSSATPQLPSGSRRKPNRRPRPAGPNEEGSSEGPEPAVDTLGAEAELMAQGRKALREADDARLLRLMARHRTEFPEGALVHEREAWESIARCRANTATQAVRERVGQAFLERHASSPWSAKIERACAGVEETSTKSRDGNGSPKATGE
ncbi:MAG: hypothetical protein ACRBN8_11420 [Nannocystales bacterium]